LLGAALTDDTAYRRLAFLTDRIGNRLSGSAALDAAISWAVKEMQSDGFDAVRAEPVQVPVWVRGAESAEVLEPIVRPLTVLGIGGSVGTPPAGISAEVIVVSNFDDLNARAEQVRGKIVCFNARFTSYGETVRYRGAGASAAARLGAVAVLVRSVGPVSLHTPHTGALSYASDAPRIPAACVTIEDAETFARMQARGERVRVRISMEARTLADALSANVVAEIRGAERPDEVVLLGAHLDSWDVGAGAHDDGGGCLQVWEAARLIVRLGLRPRRTIRVVLFTNEENGARGATAYASAHRAKASDHVMAIESDGGTFKPVGFGITAGPRGRSYVQEIVQLLAPLEATDLDTTGGSGTDIEPLGKLGVPTMGFRVDGTHYFHYHHTAADTLDKIRPRDLAECVASLAIVAFVLADIKERFEQ
jgi:carboxypeptidase Q